MQNTSFSNRAPSNLHDAVASREIAQGLLEAATTDLMQCFWHFPSHGALDPRPAILRLTELLMIPHDGSDELPKDAHNAARALVDLMLAAFALGHFPMFHACFDWIMEHGQRYGPDHDSMINAVNLLDALGSEFPHLKFGKLNEKLVKDQKRVTRLKKAKATKPRAA